MARGGHDRHVLQLFSNDNQASKGRKEEKMTFALQALRERFSRLNSDDLMLIADASDLREELVNALARRYECSEERAAQMLENATAADTWSHRHKSAPAG